MKKTVSKSTVSGTVSPPCSKSYAQRAMAAALLAEGESVLGNIELCDDTRHALRTIEDLGATVNIIDDRTISIKGGLDPRTDTINTGESGLAARLFTPIAALCDRQITIHGSGSMLRRPIGMMVRPLEQLGVEVNTDGLLPITVKGPFKGGEATAEGFVSSQFITGLLTALPLAAKDTILHVENPHSTPYISMTVDMAARFGIRLQHNDFREFFIEGGQRYSPTRLDIEGDWGCAAFMLVAGAVAGEVTVTGMNPVSLQADTQIIRALLHAGARLSMEPDRITGSRSDMEAFYFDATDCPDLFPILSVLAANCDGKSVIKGVERLFHKESDRAAAILEEFGGLGMDVCIEDGNYMVVTGGPLRGGTMDSRGDHRIAMAGAIAGLTSEHPVTITGAEAVSKSYPRFWNDLDSIMN